MAIPPYSSLKQGLAIVLLGITSAFSCLGDSWSEQRWRTDEGLTSNVVSSILQDEDGSLLIATQSGLVLYDGNKMRPTTAPEPPAPHTPIRQLLRTRDGSLWIAYTSGAIRNVTTKNVRIYQIQSEKNSHPSDLKEDAEGNIWGGYTDGVAGNWGHKDQPVFRISPTGIDYFDQTNGLPSQARARITCGLKVWAVADGRLWLFDSNRFSPVLPQLDTAFLAAPAKSGGIWVASDKSVSLCSESTPFAISATHPFSVKPNKGTVPTALLDGGADGLWLGMSDGTVLRKLGSSFRVISNLGFKVTSLLQDHEGSFWAGTDGGGLVRLRPKILSTLTETAGASNIQARSFALDKNGFSWIVSEAGTLKKGRGNEWQQVPWSQDWQRSQPTCVLADKEGSVWVGENNGKLYRSVENTLISVEVPWENESPRIRYLHLSKDDTLWVAAGSSLWSKKEGAPWRQWSTREIQGYIQTLAEDSTGRIWAGTSDGLLLRAEAGKLQTVSPPECSQSDSIRCLSATPDGALWIGRNSSGLTRLKHNVFSVITAPLPSGGISAIHLDPKQHLWCAGDQGIFCANLDDLNAAADTGLARFHVWKFGKCDGLPSLQSPFGYGPKELTDENHRFWFATSSAVVVVDPASVGTNTKPPTVKIDALNFDNQRYIGDEIPSKITLPPDHRNIDVEFGLRSFIDPENIRFQFRLDGIDRDWRVPTTEPGATFSRLKKGVYRLHVRGCNNDGVWSQESSPLELHVLPFFWETVWFRALCFVALVSAVAGILRVFLSMRWRKEREQLEKKAAVEQERIRIARDLHDELGASLTRIGLSAKLASLAPAETATHLSNIAKITASVSDSLDELVWAIDPRANNLSDLLGYIGQYTATFLEHSGIEYHLDFPDETPRVELREEVRHNLFLVIKEALNNALKHSRATRVSIRFSYSSTNIAIEFSDNGTGFNQAAVASRAEGASGLDNMNHRIQTIGGVFRVHSHPGQGTRLTIEWSWQPSPSTPPPATANLL